MSVAAVVGEPQTIGSLIDQLFELRERKRALDAQLKDIKAEMAEIEQQILERMSEQDLSQTRGRFATATRTESVVPTVKDWDRFYEYIRRHDALYLLERRPAVAAWRELYESGELPDGTEPFTKYGLSLRKVRQ